MTTEPRSPTPTRRPAGWKLRGLLLLAVGAAFYYSFEVLNQTVTESLISESADQGVIQIAETPQVGGKNVSTPGVGNELLKRAVLALDRHAALSAKVRQTGWIAGQSVETRGDYSQLGSGAKRKFLFRQQGLVAGSPMRLLRVSDNRMLWTDLAWGDNPDTAQRSVTRVDLRRVRRALAESEPLDRLATNPGAWSRYGGLPTLLSGLEETFVFGPPYRMQLREEFVLAMVGRWRADRLAELAPGGPPARTPHHVVIALVERDLSPVLLEYRSRQDPLSAEGLTDLRLLRPSSRPLMKIDLAVNTTPEAMPDARLFTYRVNTEGFVDQTDRELRLVKASRTPRVAGVDPATR